MPSHFIEIESPSLNPSEAAHRQLTLEWTNLSLTTQIKNPKTRQTEDKTILNGVSGYAKPGELLVMMGPSGAGKSSLLDCISGRNPHVQGSVTINGEPWNKSLKRLASYVMQDDLFYATITVREHLSFQARLRMGATHTADQYSRRVDEVMEELGLAKCRDTLIGGPSLRGISGGERKRLSFAAEILTNPSLLFVDEPTSGLDSFMAESVVLQLQQIARGGRTVIATIHQPSSEIFALFDQLYLLSDGSPVYHGKASAAVEYFANQGLQCPAYLNPSDYFMRQLVVVDKATDSAGVERVEGLKTAWKKHHETAMVSSPQAESNGLELKSESDVDPEVSLLSQMLVLGKRNFLQLNRDVVMISATLVQSLFTALLVGLTYLDLSMSQRNVQNFVGAFYFLALNQMYAACYPTFAAVPLDLPIVSREYGNGLFRLLAWYVAKNVSEIPLHIVNPILAYAPAHLLINIGGGFKLFFYLQVIMFLINSCAVGLGYMVATWVRRVDLSPIIGFIIMLPFMIFSGLLVNVDDAPAYFSWIQDISPVLYGFKGFMQLFWQQVDAIPCDDGSDTCAVRSGDDVLRQYGMVSGSPVGSALALLMINLVFRVLGFIGLWLAVRAKKQH